MNPGSLHASSFLQVFRNTPEDSSPFLIWVAVGFVLYGFGIGVGSLLRDIPNRFRSTEPDWRDHLWFFRQIYVGMGATIGGLGVLMFIRITYWGVSSALLGHLYAPLIGCGILIISFTAVSSFLSSLK